MIRSGKERVPPESLDALLKEAETLAESSDTSLTLPALRRLIRRVNPARCKCRSADGAGKVDLKHASPVELLSALRMDVDAAQRDDPPYKVAEKLFRGKDEGPGIPSAVNCVADAIAAGAVDFTATVHDARLFRISNPLESAESHGFDVFGLTSYDGFYIIPGALSHEQVEYWVKRVCHDFIEPPNRRNIDAHIDPDVSNQPQLAAPVASQTAAAGPLPASAFVTGLWTRHLRSVEAGGEGDEAAAAAAVDNPTPAAAPGERVAPASPMRGLSWATLGLQYDWTARAYHLPTDPDYAIHQHPVDPDSSDDNSSTARQRERWSAPFPSDLHSWAAETVRALNAAVESYWVTHVLPSVQARETVVDAAAGRGGLAAGDGDATAASRAAWGLPLTLDAQAGIVNIYHPSTGPKLPMGGHSDDMERSLTHPVLSVSLGCTAIFLLGGDSKASAPTPIILRSGDVMVLSGSVRTAIHGVARVFAGTSPSELFSAAPVRTSSSRAVAQGDGTCPHRESSLEHAGIDSLQPDETAAFAAFMGDTRININLRQVVDSCFV